MATLIVKLKENPHQKDYSKEKLSSRQLDLVFDAIVPSQKMVSYHPF